MVYIGIGSNIEDRMNYVETAITKIDADKACSIEKISSFYESKPFGNIEQENFINLVVFVKTIYEPAVLFSFLKKIELEMGRRNSSRWGPREIDLDILFYNDLIYQDDKLIIPHKGITERDFVLFPICEIAPNFIHPAINKKICDICNEKLKKNIISKIPQTIFIK